MGENRPPSSATTVARPGEELVITQECDDEECTSQCKESSPSLSTMDLVLFLEQQFFSLECRMK
jgi:hypothetical protein